MPQLPADEGGHRWLALGEDALPAGEQWLAPGEATILAGLRYTKRRTEYLLRRYVTKQAVASVIGEATDPGVLARIEVRNAPSGAPYVVVDGDPLALGVSISDRAGWAVCVTCPSDSPAVGCDLELVEPRTPGFVADFLTAAEQRLVAARPAGDERDAAANLIWSAKESALKVLRTGLRRDTRSLEVALAAPTRRRLGRVDRACRRRPGIPRLVAAGRPLSADCRRGDGHVAPGRALRPGHPRARSAAALLAGPAVTRLTCLARRRRRCRAATPRR